MHNDERERREKRQWIVQQQQLGRNERSSSRAGGFANQQHRQERGSIVYNHLDYWGRPLWDRTEKGEAEENWHSKDTAKIWGDMKRLRKVFLQESDWEKHARKEIGDNLRAPGRVPSKGEKVTGEGEAQVHQTPLQVPVRASGTQKIRRTEGFKGGGGGAPP